MMNQPGIPHMVQQSVELLLQIEQAVQLPTHFVEIRQRRASEGLHHPVGDGGLSHELKLVQKQLLLVDMTGQLEEAMGIQLSGQEDMHHQPTLLTGLLARLFQGDQSLNVLLQMNRANIGHQTLLENNGLMNEVAIGIKGTAMVAKLRQPLQEVLQLAPCRAQFSGNGIGCAGVVEGFDLLICLCSRLLQAGFEVGAGFGGQVMAELNSMQAPLLGQHGIQVDQLLDKLEMTFGLQVAFVLRNPVAKDKIAGAHQQDNGQCNGQRLQAA